MQNEEEINIDNNKKNTNILSSKITKKLNKLIFIQILNCLVIFLLFFATHSLKIKNKSNLLSINGENYNNSIKKNILTDTLTDKIKLLKMLTNNDELEYKGMLECLISENPDSQHCIYHLISPKKVIGKNRILLGTKKDGCYVLLDDFQNIKIAYSFGISINIQFDKALADKGIDVYMYDHTINALPFQNNKFHWKKIGLCGKRRKGKNMRTLEELLQENGHIQENNMILKMDIEKWEWDSLDTLNDEILKKFKYIAIEYHFDDESYFNKTYLYYKVLKKISKSHQSFYARCNGQRHKKINFGFNRICHILEVCYIIKKDNVFTKDETVYPIYEFDYSKPRRGILETNLNILKLFD